MRSLNHRGRKLYNRRPSKSTCHLNLFFRVAVRYMERILSNWKINTPRGMATTLKTCPSNNSSLMNTSTVLQV